MDIKSALSKFEKVYDNFVKTSIKFNPHHNDPNIIFSSIYVDLYGKAVAIFGCASIVPIDNNTYRLTLYDRNSAKDIAAALEAANKGFLIANKGDHIIVKLPPLTLERRQLLVKELKKKAEATKIQLRQERHNFLKAMEESEEYSDDELKRSKKQLTETVQKLSGNIEKTSDQRAHSILND
jgi:ribosome recycling factor